MSFVDLEEQTVHIIVHQLKLLLGAVVQSVVSVIAGLGVVSLIWPHTFVEIDHEIH